MGSSAGASIQAEYMVRGNPLGNQEMMAEGYEQGFGFLRGVAIDQHFTGRNRFADMSSLMQHFPQLLGIGIDGGTAIIVEGSTANVVGKGSVHFYDADAHSPDDERDYQSVKAGGATNCENVGSSRIQRAPPPVTHRSTKATYRSGCSNQTTFLLC